MDITRMLGRLAVCVAAVVATPAAVDAAQAPAQAAACSEAEGSATETALGMTLCSGTAETSLPTYDTPQKGARIAAAAESGIAHRAGLRAGDIMYQVDGRRVESGKAAADALAKPDTPGTLVINFWRDGRTYLVRIWQAK